MRKTIIALLLVMSCLLCACGREDAPSGTVTAEVADEKAQSVQEVVEENAEEYVELPFAEEMGLKFVEPREYTVPVTMYSKTPDIYLILSTSDCQLTAPQISLEADGEDYLIYTISYTGTAHQKVQLTPPEEAGTVSWGSTYNEFNVYDYYTGVEIVPDVGSPYNDETKENSRIYTVDYNDKTAEVSCTAELTQVRNSSNYWSGIYWVVEDSPVWSTVYTIRAPRDYDGLMLGIAPNVKEPAPEDPFAEKEIDDTIHYFGDEDEKVEDYEFIRVSDYVEIPTVSVSAEESD